jgi:hypothetical protein
MRVVRIEVALRQRLFEVILAFKRLLDASPEASLTPVELTLPPQHFAIIV